MISLYVSLASPISQDYRTTYQSIYSFHFVQISPRMSSNYIEFTESNSKLARSDLFRITTGTQIQANDPSVAQVARNSDIYLTFSEKGIPKMIILGGQVSTARDRVGRFLRFGARTQTRQEY